MNSELLEKLSFGELIKKIIFFNCVECIPELALYSNE